jgi:glycosyltransferase involved in cell wall biosynthesis
LKVIVVGDAVVSTGFARCTHAACDALHVAGHEVSVIGINYHGDPTDYPYTIYPAIQPYDNGRDAFGCSRLPLLIDRIKPDVCLILQDGWNIASYFSVLDSYFVDVPELIPPIVGWIAVDSKNQLAKPLNRLAHVMVWTQFGADELRAGGYNGTTAIVPLGVDHDIFYPRNKVQSRKQIGVPDDAFIVGVVARNQHRKRHDLALEILHRWVTTYDVPDAKLLMHIAPTGDVGCNIRALIHYYNLQGRVLLSEPHIGKGVDTDQLPFLYSACDVMLSTAQAEGFGLPILEAAACGVPAVLPDFAAFGPTGWVPPSSAAIRVKCSTHQLTAPMNSLAYTIGSPPDRNKVVNALAELYGHTKLREAMGKEAVRLAAQFDWARTGAMVVSELEGVVERHRATQLAAQAASSTIPTEAVDCASIEASASTVST